MFYKYLSVIPLLFNTLLIYVGLPLIFRSKDSLFIEQATAIIGFAALIGPSLLGLPVMIVRRFARAEPFTLRFRRILVGTLVLSFAISAVFLMSVRIEAVWVLIFWPSAVMNIMVRSYWESQGWFIRSYLFRAFFISVFPLMLVLGLFLHSMILIILVAMAAALRFYLDFRILRHAMRFDNLANDPLAGFMPPFLEYISVFLFIFLDRYVVGFASDPATTALFIKHAEQVYRLAAPILFITALSFPGMASFDAANRARAECELRIANLFWIVVSIAAPFIVAMIYSRAGMGSEAAYFSSHALMISVFMALMGIITAYHRRLLASDKHRIAISFFLYSMIVTSLCGAIVSLIYRSPPASYFVKALIEAGFIIFFSSRLLSQSRSTSEDMGNVLVEYTHKV